MLALRGSAPRMFDIRYAPSSGRGSGHRES
jgi:hypothetical protein